IYQWWPRDPNGPIIKETFYTIAGKRAPNAHASWSENVLGFYLTKRIPTTPQLASVVSQSRMAAYCRKIGEVDFAKDQLVQADQERDPRRREWANVTRIWEDRDAMIRYGFEGKSMRDEKHQDSPYNLQQTIPFHLLPEQLVVHDPFDLLNV
ncbi:hypothetical protein K435DRAFT_590165, partial [Dendrothele bispora CBS 962.96]